MLVHQRVKYLKTIQNTWTFPYDWGNQHPSTNYDLEYLRWVKLTSQIQFQGHPTSWDVDGSSSISVEDHDSTKWVCLKIGNTPKPNGFADHYPVFKWLFHWEYTQHFQTNPNGWTWCNMLSFRRLWRFRSSSHGTWAVSWLHGWSHVPNPTVLGCLGPKSTKPSMSLGWFQRAFMYNFNCWCFSRAASTACTGKSAKQPDGSPG